MSKELDNVKDLIESLNSLATLDYPENLHQHIMKGLDNSLENNDSNLSKEHKKERFAFIKNPSFAFRFAFAFGCIFLLVLFFDSQPDTALNYKSNTSHSISERKLEPKGIETNFEGIVKSEEIYANMAESEPLVGLEEATEAEINEFLAALDEFNRKNQESTTKTTSGNNGLELHFVTDK